MHRKLLLPSSLIVLLALVLGGCDGPNLMELAQNPLDRGFCWLIVLILDVIAIIDLIGQARSATSKLIWILLIVFLPVLGLILYYLIARKK